MLPYFCIIHLLTSTKEFLQTLLAGRLRIGLSCYMRKIASYVSVPSRSDANSQALRNRQPIWPARQIDLGVHQIGHTQDVDTSTENNCKS